MDPAGAWEQNGDLSALEPMDRCDVTWQGLDPTAHHGPIVVTVDTGDLEPARDCGVDRHGEDAAPVHDQSLHQASLRRRPLVGAGSPQISAASATSAFRTLESGAASASDCPASSAMSMLEGSSGRNRGSSIPAKRVRASRMRGSGRMPTAEDRTLLMTTVGAGPPTVP